MIAANTGPLAAYLANPALNLADAGGVYATAAGQQRGDSSDLDAYLFLKIQFHYKIYKYKTQGGHKYRTRIRRQKIVF